MAQGKTPPKPTKTHHQTPFLLFLCSFPLNFESQVLKTSKINSYKPANTWLLPLTARHPHPYSGNSGLPRQLPMGGQNLTRIHPLTSHPPPPWEFKKCSVPIIWQVIRKLNATGSFSHWLLFQYVQIFLLLSGRNQNFVKKNFSTCETHEW